MLKLIKFFNEEYLSSGKVPVLFTDPVIVTLFNTLSGISENEITSPSSNSKSLLYISNFWPILNTLEERLFQDLISSTVTLYFFEIAYRYSPFFTL